MARDLSCVLCGAQVERRLYTFVAGDKVWTVPIHICTAEKCLERRGGAYVEHRAERRLSGEMPVVPSES